MITLDDVVESFKGRWDAMPELASLVPGGMWVDRVPPEASSPYATITIADDTPSYLSTADYIQAFTVEMLVWSQDAADAESIHQAMADAFDNRQSEMVIRGGRVIRVRPQDAEHQTEASLRDAKDVSVAHFRWRVTVQGSTAFR